jgi:hypothetical protein
MFLAMTLFPFACATELEVFTYHTFGCFCSRIRLTAMLGLLGVVDLLWQELPSRVV